ncbi:MAG TPA: tRNA lysidine(34) synthetase TilS [Candidatus Competibacter sp.]|nr:tRNA lysidine(34) synthetase TilS [Candidatus Competibacter sp.]HUM95651.1 tRNA lysidine(34) synthetase TilS [Candidatus Competibacter sp.]
MAANALSPALLTALLTRHAPLRRLIVGYSGGLDSHVLLHLLARHRDLWPDRSLKAIYVDHGLQAASAGWSRHCARVCQALQVPFQVLRVDASPDAGESPEAAARRARYGALAAELEADAALLTAHHQDDQAETLLLQLLRGAGPRGLAAMPASARLGSGWLLRPLLEVGRAELSAYARAHHLQWIEDQSNADPAFDRNYLRHLIMPLLDERWPAAARNLARSARLCAETIDWLDAEAEADLAQAATARADALSIPALRALREIRQRNLVRYWLRQLGLPVPDHRHLQHILHDHLTSGRDRRPCVRWPGGEIRRFRDRLHAMPPLSPHDASSVLTWRPEPQGWPPLDLPALGQLRMQQTIGAGLRADRLGDRPLTVRFRTGGERFQPAGRRHGQELKKLLLEAGIPPWERDRLPLLYEGGSLLAVVGLGIAAERAAAAGEIGWQTVLHSPSAAGSGIL